MFAYISFRRAKRPHPYRLLATFLWLLPSQLRAKGNVIMNRLIQNISPRSGVLLALVIATAVALGLAAPANAANSRGPITASFDRSTGVLTVTGNQQDNIIIVSR